MNLDTTKFILRTGTKYILLPHYILLLQIQILTVMSYRKRL